MIEHFSLEDLPKTIKILFSVDFTDFLLKRRHLKNFEKFTNRKELKIQYNDDKEIIDSNIDFFTFY